MKANSYCSDDEIYTILRLNSRSQLLLFSAHSAICYYKNFSIDLISGMKKPHSFEDLVKKIQKQKIKDESNRKQIFHLFYECGHIFENLSHLVNENSPLAIWINYEKHEIIKTQQRTKQKPSIKISFDPRNLNGKKAFEKYRKKFRLVMDHLEKGDAYQINLTENFNFKFEKSEAFIKVICHLFQQSSCGTYAHFTNLPSMKMAILSNSPECLFSSRKIDSNTFDISSRPIKGSIPYRKGLDSMGKKWKELSAPKFMSELNIITDLIRNDMSRINLSPSYVLHQRLPLLVPGILHQYSLVQARMDGHTSLYKIISSLFPGGSITGAPKKRVLKIINKVENSSRGIYCGSTIFRFQNILEASINIRTGLYYYDTSQFSYGAGGGITLRSNALDEFEEMIKKYSSFMSFLGKNK